ncbi:Las1-like-domain-containing protein [Lineolata rhizophorae]|uniref:Las1-like-domain-containing protein n=1 Tax=Lineolata rhizophorae TaxID=578093 RepID=A0A6A6NNZ3_9PEZI|nr:Las1-like-domain-containing protein [Lineolata rhizophorae]
MVSSDPIIGAHEVAAVRDGLFGSIETPEGLQRAESAATRVLKWKERCREAGKLPAVVGLTASMVACLVEDKKRPPPDGDDETAEETFANALCSAFTRFVTMCCNPELTASKTVPMRLVAAQRKFPTSWVIARNLVIHDQLLPLGFAREATREAVDWARSHIWDAFAEGISLEDQFAPPLPEFAGKWTPEEADAWIEGLVSEYLLRTKSESDIYEDLAVSKAGGLALADWLVKTERLISGQFGEYDKLIEFFDGKVPIFLQRLMRQALRYAKHPHPDDPLFPEKKERVVSWIMHVLENAPLAKKATSKTLREDMLCLCIPDMDQWSVGVAERLLNTASSKFRRMHGFLLDDMRKALASSELAASASHAAPANEEGTELVDAGAAGGDEATPKIDEQVAGPSIDASGNDHGSS